MSDSYRDYWRNTIKAYATGGTYYHTNFAEGAPAMHTAKEVIHEKTLPLKMQKKRAAVVNSKLSQPRGDRKILAQVLAPPLAPAAAAAPAPPPPAPSPPQPDPTPLPPGPPQRPPPQRPPPQRPPPQRPPPAQPSSSTAVVNVKKEPKDTGQTRQYDFAYTTGDQRGSTRDDETDHKLDHSNGADARKERKLEAERPVKEEAAKMASKVRHNDAGFSKIFARVDLAAENAMTTKQLRETNLAIFHLLKDNDLTSSQTRRLNEMRRVIKREIKERNSETVRASAAS